MAKNSTIIQTRYDSTHCKNYHLKLHLTLDADIIKKLSSVPSMQGYIKQLIRDDLARTRTFDLTDPDWQTIVNLMDDDIRESVHADLSPCTEKDFLLEYQKRHREKYGEDFTW